MTIEQSNVIDFVGVDRLTDKVVLTISDHLSWEDVRSHTTALREKIGAYVTFVEGGQLVQSYPNAKGRRVEIRIICEYEPNSSGSAVFESLRREVEGCGMDFSCIQLPEGY